jgi:hypothetical protein
MITYTITDQPERIKIELVVDTVTVSTTYVGKNNAVLRVQDGFIYLLETTTRNEVKMPRPLIVPVQADDTAAEAYFRSILYA